VVVGIKLFSAGLELRTLASLCNAPTGEASVYLLSHLTGDHFHYEPCKVGYKRIVKLMQTRGEVPSYHELEADPVIDEDLREILSANEYKKKRIRDEQKAKDQFDLLESYRKTRVAYFTAKATIDALKQSSVDIDQVILNMGDGLAVARSAVKHQEQLVHIGQGNNSAAIVKEVLYGESEPTIPTGFKTFDQKNGGFFKPAVAILSSNSSGGKSVAALQMAVNMYYSKHSTCVLSLEMSKEQYMARFLSNISGVSATKIFLKTFTKEEEAKIKAAYKKFVLFGKKHNVRWTILAPEQGMTLDQLLMTCKPYGFDVITIDYLSLLEEADVENQARALASITRKCKVFTQSAGCLMILLAQLNEEGLIKYSRAIKENADHVWTWVYGDTERETHLITMRVDKGRNQLCFPFEVTEDYSVMSLIDSGPVKNFNSEESMSTSKRKADADDANYLEEDEL
jgi:archaellum biogenesis ATPase FlaH